MSTSFPPPPPEDPINPYAAPATEIGPEPTGLDAEGTSPRPRRSAGRTSATRRPIRSLGSLHYLGAILGLIACRVHALHALRGRVRWPGRPLERMLLGGIVVVYLLVTALNFALGIRPARLQPWARWTETALLSLQVIFVVLGDRRADRDVPR